MQKIHKIMATFQNEQMLEVFFFYREIALQYLLSNHSMTFQKTDKNHIMGISDSPTMSMYDDLSIRRFQLAIAVEKEVYELPGIVETLTQILTKAKIAMYENNQRKIQKV